VAGSALLQDSPLDFNLHLSQVHRIPDIIEFVTSEKYLNRTLYPRQATLLKIIFLQTELFTDYDHEVIEQWTREFSLPPMDKWDPEKPLRYQGQWGIQPDIYERIEMCKADGRLWFREVLAVIGRRGGKGYLGALCGAYVLWHYLSHGNPQDHYSIDRDKRLASLVFAGKREQAKQNQWRDLVQVIRNAPCFLGINPWGRNLISQEMNESLTIYAPIDIHRKKEAGKIGRTTTMDLSTFEILPKEATSMAGRGPASFLLYFDEMAHVVASGANRGADELYDSATPSLDQFGKDGFIYSGSSPWQMIGKFYALCMDALEVEPGNFDPVHYDKLIIQLASWDIYEDWKRAHAIPLVPLAYAKKLAADHYNDEGTLVEGNSFYLEEAPGADGRKAYVRRCFARIKKPVQQFDAQMKRLERANPETFAVERRSRWAAALDNYLNPVLVDRMFEPYLGKPLQMQSKGILKQTYMAHGDPSKSGANFGWAIAHTEGPDEQGMMHVVIDKVHHWEPSTFEDGQIDYPAIGKYIGDDIVSFLIEDVSFDQFNSVEIMQRLRRRVAEQRLPKRINIHEQTATAPLNWKIAETFKTALGMNLIHAPYYEQLELESKFLILKNGSKVDHPDMGPVQTKDVWDAVSNVVWKLIGEQMMAFMGAEFAAVGIGGMVPVAQGRMESSHDADIHQALSSLARRRTVAQQAQMPVSRGGRRR
jgi:hypothetical protein